MLQNDRLIKALLRQPVDRTPVWIMRQAGRYLPEYRKLRQSAGSFMALCQNPELATQVTLQPLERFDLDAAILFSDILTIPDAQGLGLRFVAGEGPVFENPISSVSDIDNLPIVDPHQSLGYVLETVKQCRQALAGRVPLIGFSGSPWTLATYMVEGGSSKTFSKVRSLMYSDPKSLAKLLDKLAKSVIAYLNAQIEAGAQAVMIFDSWGGLLGPQTYSQFSLYYMRMIIDGLIKERDGQRIPNIIFTKGGGNWLAEMADSGVDALGLDWTVNLADARKMVGDRVALQGNLDPAALYGSPESIKQQVAKVLADYGSGYGHVFNLGHGIYPDVNPDHVKVLVDSVHELSGEDK